jgi:hypothetical protein
MRDKKCSSKVFVINFGGQIKYRFTNNMSIVWSLTTLAAMPIGQKRAKQKVISPQVVHWICGTLTLTQILLLVAWDSLGSTFG